MTADVIILNRPPEQSYMSCDRCGWKEWALVCEDGRIVQFVCTNDDCNAVYDLKDNNMSEEEIKTEDMILMEDADGNTELEFLSDVEGDPDAEGDAFI